MHICVAGMEYNFDKFGTSQINSRGSAYDYKSVMHYSSYGFSINGQPTLVDLNDNPINVQVSSLHSML